MSLSDSIFTTETGPGLFGKLIDEAASKAAKEARLQNLTTAEYAKVYLGLMQSAMSISAEVALAQDSTEQEIARLIAQTAKIEAETALVEKQTELADINRAIAAKQLERADEEIALSAAKRKTEEAQTIAANVDLNSVIGRQKALYQAQTHGYARDAEQKAAKMLIDTWNVRRTTDDETQATATNKLTDTEIGLAVQRMLDGAVASNSQDIVGNEYEEDVGGDIVG